MAATVIESPIGNVWIAANEEAVTAVRFGTCDLPDERENAITKLAAKQLAEYFAGKRREFDLPLDLPGTDFQCRVWAELLNIPFGTAISYAELAERIGQPKAARAVGGANGRNPACIVVPCHRVIATDGTLGGFGYGLDTKAWLLRLEGFGRSVTT
jgi:methylated-DNA-[protein]-cysteine S-methyltransferase